MKRLIGETKSIGHLPSKLLITQDSKKGLVQLSQIILTAAVLALMISNPAWADTVSVPNTFSSGQTASASEVILVQA
jgi:hypothetical protein